MRFVRLPEVFAMLALLAALPSCIESFSLRDPCVANNGGCPAGERCAGTPDGGVTCSCGPGLTRVGSACSPPPRPLSPLSTATVTSRRPTLRWAFTVGDGAHVDLCRDRALTTGCLPFDVSERSGRPATDLEPGVWFWRLAARAGGATTSAVGPVWQFTVGARSAPLDRSWGSTLDVNGDGYADVAVGTSRFNAAYVYLGGEGEAALRAEPITLTGPAGTSFGNWVASAGDVNGDGYADLVVGSEPANAAYLYLGGSGAPPLSAPPIRLAGPAGSASFGISVASAGDVNADGYADLVVGASRSNTAYVYLGSAGETPLSATPILLNGPTRSASFGNSVASAGDVDGDGYADVAVGAYDSDTAYVYLGGAGETPLRATPITLSGPVGSRLGGSVSSADDVNGDGYADLVVGAHLANRAYVYLGGAGEAALNATPIILNGPAGASSFGGGDSAGDINRDGYSDVVANGPGFNLSHVYLGAPEATALSAAPIVVRGPGGSEYFGTHSAGAGDVNGDGYDDFVVGAFTSASAYVYLGRPGAVPVGDTPIALFGPSGSLFGVSVASRARLTPSGSRAARVRLTAAVAPPAPGERARERGS